MLVDLLLNVVTQLVCVAGVNQLASTSTALSVSIVLNLRKFTSLVLSFVVFGHKLHAGLVVGAILVFVGAFWYSQESPHMPSKLDVKSSRVDLPALSHSVGATRRKNQGTPMLETGEFAEMSSSSSSSDDRPVTYGHRRKSSSMPSG